MATWALITIGLVAALLIIGLVLDLRARRRGRRQDVDVAAVERARRRALDRGEENARKSSGPL